MTCDVVVVGARVAGAATALLLARSGLRVELLDRGRCGADTLSTHALMRGAVLQLHRWGLLPQVVAAGTPPVRQVSFRYDGQVVPVPIKEAHGVPALYAPRRTVLDPILVEAARAAGARVRHGLAVTRVVQGASGRVEGVVARTRDGRYVPIRARLVVGADGIRSTVAEQVKARVLRRGRGRSATTYGYWGGLDVDGYVWSFGQRTASGAIATNDGRACVFGSAPPGRIGRGGRGPLLQVLALTDPGLAARIAASPAVPMRTFTGIPGYVRQAWGAGWALVGDAGYYKDPQSAHGITDALRDAELLARAVLATLDGGDEATELAAYQAQRDALSADLFDVTDTIAGYRWSDAEIGPLLLRLNAAMVEEVDALAAMPVPPGLTAST